MNETLKFNALLKMPKLLKEISSEAEISHHGTIRTDLNRVVDCKWIKLFSNQPVLELATA